MEITLLLVGLAVGVLATLAITHFAHKASAQRLSSETQMLRQQLDEQQKRETTDKQKIEQQEREILRLTAENSKANTLADSQKANYEQARSALEAEQKARKEECERQTELLSTRTSEKETLQKELEMVRKQNAEEAQKRDENFAKQLQLAQEQLKNATQEMLKSNREELQSANNEQLNGILNPLKENINSFRMRVDELHDKDVEAQASMAKELEKLRQMNESIGKEANDLASALRNNSKSQGNWGEMLLERQLELMGFQEGKHYVRQSFIKDDNGLDIKGEDNKRLQPDIIIKYPGGRELIVDSKVSLTDYVLSVGTEDADERREHLAAHLRSIRAHINELSAKQYGKLNQGRSPECVLMFIPNESAYISAIEADGKLWDDAFAQKVVLVGPSSIMTALHLAMDLWKREDQATNIQKIVNEATNLYEKMATFTSTFLAIGKSIDATQSSYSQALNQLKEGRGNIIRRFEKIRELGLAPNKQIGITPEAED